MYFSTLVPSTFAAVATVSYNSTMEVGVRGYSWLTSGQSQIPDFCLMLMGFRKNRMVSIHYELSTLVP